MEASCHRQYSFSWLFGGLIHWLFLRGILLFSECTISRFEAKGKVFLALSMNSVYNGNNGRGKIVQNWEAWIWKNG